jgi:hypothetical protein
VSSCWRSSHIRSLPANCFHIRSGMSTIDVLKALDMYIRGPGHFIEMLLNEVLYPSFQCIGDLRYNGRNCHQHEDQPPSSRLQSCASKVEFRLASSIAMYIYWLMECLKQFDRIVGVARLPPGGYHQGGYNTFKQVLLHWNRPSLRFLLATSSTMQNNASHTPWHTAAPKL